MSYASKREKMILVYLEFLGRLTMPKWDEKEV